jgi:hypothetical protein
MNSSAIQQCQLISEYIVCMQFSIIKFIIEEYSNICELINSMISCFEHYYSFRGSQEIFCQLVEACTAQDFT